jgi:hypothetical protein
MGLLLFVVDCGRRLAGIMSKLPQCVKERFMGKVCKRTGCWIWIGPKFRKGYGKFITYRRGKRTVYLAHRWSYMTWNGKIKRKREIHHTCEKKACVNPEHLMSVTRRQHNRIHAKARSERARYR